MLAICGRAHRHGKCNVRMILHDFEVERIGGAEEDRTPDLSLTKQMVRF